MINELVKELTDIEKNYKIMYLGSRKNTFLAYLIYLKYLCDNNKYNYDEVINSYELYPITKDISIISKRLSKERLPINNLLLLIKDIPIKELVEDFLNYLDKKIELHNNQDKLLYIGFDYDIYSYYNKNGNATYLIEENTLDNYNLFKMFDEVLGINNTYLEKTTNKNPSNYDYIYIIDNTPRYLTTKYNNIYINIYDYIRNNKQVVLYTNYSKISNFTTGRIIAKYLRKIIISKNKTVMLFSNQTNTDKISIINYNKDKIKNLDKLYSIIKNNRKQKDILTKTTYQELCNNNLRIGFNLYQLEKNNEIRDINKIVDENTNYLNELNRLNEQVEKEINILLNR